MKPPGALHPPPVPAAQQVQNHAFPPRVFPPAPAFPPLPRSYTLQLFQTTTFQNTTLVDTEGLGLLHDIELGFLDNRTWNIHFLQPWVHPALPQSDWDTINAMIKIYLQKFHHLVQEGAVKKRVPYPFVAQCTAGCELFPNRTSRGFLYVGYNGQDFLSYDIDNGTWLLLQDTELSRYVQETLKNYTAFTELIQVLFNDTCVDDMEIILHYAKEALERQVKPVAVVFARPSGPGSLLLVCRVTGFFPRGPLKVPADGCTGPQKLNNDPELVKTKRSQPASIIRAGAASSPCSGPKSLRVLPEAGRAPQRRAAAGQAQAAPASGSHEPCRFAAPLTNRVHSLCAPTSLYSA
nr:PREDICTED: antigen-presenting glycoprotein CD1d-like [Struthio camelus australis]